MPTKTVYCRFAPGVVAIMFVIAFAATGLVYGQVSATPGPYKAEAPANRGLDATLYMQTAAEYRASCYQAYNLATARLDELIKGGAGKFAVVMDLDETVFDNSRFQAMLLKNGLAWDKDLWAEWERDYSKDVMLVPGAKEFIEKATHSTGVEVFFVSNRNGKEFKQQAQDALARLGIPLKDADHLKLADPEAPDSSNKTKRFQEVKEKCSCEVLLYIGDNLRDFDNDLRFAKLPEKASAEDLDRAIAERKDALDKARGNFGQNWVILPNPTYGEWKAPLGRGQADFDRLTAAVFPLPAPSASPSPSAHKHCAQKECVSSQKRSRNIDPAIVAAVIAFVSTAIMYFWRKRSERRSINRGILAEIRRLLTVVKSHREWWAKRIKEEDTNHPLIPFSHAVYSKQVSNIGALTNRLVGRAVTFYGYLGFINSLQRARPEYIANGKRTEFDKMYLGVLTSFLTDYEHAFEEDFGGIE